MQEGKPLNTKHSRQSNIESAQTVTKSRKVQAPKHLLSLWNFLQIKNQLKEHIFRFFFFNSKSVNI